MTPEEMRAKSSTKVKQILDLMKVLQVSCEVRTKMDEGGFIQDMVFWIDNEKYPSAPVPATAPVTPEVSEAGGAGGDGLKKEVGETHA